jgi:hypothetical protein
MEPLKDVIWGLKGILFADTYAASVNFVFLQKPMSNRFVTITLCMLSLCLFHFPMALCTQGSEETLGGEEVKKGALPEICNPCVPEPGKHANERAGICIWKESAASEVGEDIIEAINKAFAEYEDATMEIRKALKEKDGGTLLLVRVFRKRYVSIGRIIKILRVRKGKEESLEEVSANMAFRLFLQEKKVGPKAKDTFDPEEIEVLPLEDGEQCVVLIWYLE